MQVIGVLLTRHVLNHYTRFVQGINDIGELQDELQSTLSKVKETRTFTRNIASDLSQSLTVCHDSKRKQQLGQLLDAMYQLRIIKDLDSSLRYGVLNLITSVLETLIQNPFQGPQSLP